MDDAELGLSDWAKQYFQQAMGAPSGAPRPTAHARLGFSGAERYMACAGSPNACDGLPDIATPYAREGSAAHEVAAACLVDGMEPVEWLDREIDLGDGGPKIPVDAEMVEHLEGYLRLIAEEMNFGFETEILHGTETRGDIEKLDPEFFALEPIFGTCDKWIYRRKLKRLTVIDLKYGRGVVVEVEGKPQTRGYALMLLLSDLLMNEKIEEVELVIYQPRAFHRNGPTRRQVISVEELLRWATEDLLPKAKATRDPNAPRVAGDHCLFCRAAPTCDTLRQHAFEIARVEFGSLDVIPNDFQPMPPKPSDLTPDQLARILNVIPNMINWVSGVRQYALGLAQTGVEIVTADGQYRQKLVERMGHRKWADGDDAIKLALIMNLGIPEDQIYQDPKLKSPAMIEKTLREIYGHGKWKSVAARISGGQLTKVPSAGYSLVPEKNSKEEVTLEAAEMFERLD